MEIVKVEDRGQEKAFLEVARSIYADDEQWVCPMDVEIQRIFNPLKNHYFEFGTCARWILLDESGQAIGRIAAFINYRKVNINGRQTGGIGFFECINRQQAADRLFSTAAEWLKTFDMEVMIGPINFGENDQYWGLLVEGFSPPSYGMNYHKPYYEALFRRFGFETEYEQITNVLSVSKPFPERFERIANWVESKPGYEFRKFKKSKIREFGADFVEIYNDAWQDFKGFHPINEQTIHESFQKMKLIMDERFIWFSYVNGDPAAFLLVLPDANQLIKPLKGKITLRGLFKLAANRRRNMTRLRAVVMGTKKKYQKHGLESALFIQLKKEVLPLNKYKELELSWVGDFNADMLSIHNATGARFSKKHLTMGIRLNNELGTGLS